MNIVCCVCTVLYCMNTVYSILYTEHCILYNLWWISISSRLAKQSGGMIILTSNIFSQQWFPFMMLNYAIMILAACNKYGGKADWKVRPVKTNFEKNMQKYFMAPNVISTAEYKFWTLNNIWVVYNDNSSTFMINT